MAEQKHQWTQNPLALELICERCGWGFAISGVARMGWDINSEDDIYWALGGSGLFSDGCCPRRVN